MPKKTRQTPEDIAQLKKDYISYFEDVPVQKYAAMSIARTEDTIINWKKADEEFSDAVNQAKSKFIQKRLLAAKAEFALERLEKEVFKESIETEITLPTPILNSLSKESKDDEEDL